MENKTLQAWRNLMSNKARKNLLDDQRDALKSYLEELLLEVEEYSPTQESSATTAAETTITSAPIIKPTHSSDDTEDSQIEEVSAALANTAVDEQANAAREHAQHPPNDDVVGQAINKPSWAETPFQVLIFEISGMSYAIPLNSLHGIVPMPERLTQVPSKIAWFLGLFRNRGINVKVIDVEKLWQHESTSITRQRDGNKAYVLLIDEGRFGFVVSKVKTIMKLHGDEVKWRHSPGFAGVLVGSIPSNMATLIDTSALNHGLHAGIWAGKRN